MNTKDFVRVPIELFLDICRMVEQGGLLAQVLGCQEALGLVNMEFAYNISNHRQKAAIENINAVVAEWNKLRHGHERTGQIF